jgi:exodeoxyribonuclease-3
MKKTITLLSWNVNGLRAVLKKDFLKWLDKENPDILCLQETKAHPDQLSKDVLEHDSYHSYFDASTVKKGYSGVATFTKIKPLKVEQGIGIPKFDQEGRTLITEFEDFVLLNVYFPNGGSGTERLNFKLEFYNAFLKKIDALKKKGKKIIFCGDINTAHKEIDLFHPKENENSSGFMPIERKWIDQVIDHGYIDTFREFNQKPLQYTWWDMKTHARARNVGWRIDNFFIQKELRKNLKDAFILPEVMGSDHCPVGIKMSF